MISSSKKCPLWYNITLISLLFLLLFFRVTSIALTGEETSMCRVEVNTETRLAHPWQFICYLRGYLGITWEKSTLIKSCRHVIVMLNEKMMYEWGNDVPGELQPMSFLKKWGLDTACHSSIFPTNIYQNCTHHISCYTDFHWEPITDRNKIKSIIMIEKFNITSVG